MHIMPVAQEVLPGSADMKICYFIISNKNCNVQGTAMKRTVERRVAQQKRELSLAVVLSFTVLMFLITHLPRRGCCYISLNSNYKFPILHFFPNCYAPNSLCLEFCLFCLQKCKEILRYLSFQKNLFSFMWRYVDLNLFFLLSFLKANMNPSKSSKDSHILSNRIMSSP